MPTNKMGDNLGWVGNLVGQFYSTAGSYLEVSLKIRRVPLDLRVRDLVEENPFGRGLAIDFPGAEVRVAAL